MHWYITVAVQLVKAYRQAALKKGSFFAVASGIFVLSVVTLSAYDLLPEAKTAVATPATTIESVVSVMPVAEDPMRIEVPAIDLAVAIRNPVTTDIATLDKELLSGAVRYPTSARLGETGNVVVFGHSSYLPVVGNQAYKAFNGIQKLVPGDTVTVYSSGTAYTYRVRSMEKKSATDAGIPLLVTGRVLTLATCDSFGTKSDRFVVTADFVESHPIST